MNDLVAPHLALSVSTFLQRPGHTFAVHHTLGSASEVSGGCQKAPTLNMNGWDLGLSFKLNFKENDAPFGANIHFS